MRARAAAGKTCSQSVQGRMALNGNGRMNAGQGNQSWRIKDAAQEADAVVYVDLEGSAATPRDWRNGAMPVELHDAMRVAADRDAAVCDVDAAVNAAAWMRAGKRFEAEVLSSPGRASVLPTSVARKYRTSALLWVAQ